MTTDDRIGTHYDAIVVGARCAGAATAMLLARAGASVLAVDRSPYGSDTLSTHALMRGAVVQLHRWGVLPEIVAAWTPRIETTTFHYGPRPVTVEIKPKHGVDALFAPRRSVLDRALVDAAVASGATVVHGPRVLDVRRDPDGRIAGVRLQARDEGPPRDVSAGIVIGADGLRSTVADRVGARIYQRGRHATGVVYGYFAGVGLDGYQWYFQPGLAAGVIPTNGGASCVFAAVSAAEFRAVFGGQLEQGFTRVIASVSADLASRVQFAAPVGRLRGFPGQVGQFRESAGPGWALVGDAGYFKDTLTAHGITDALRDAELLARAVTAGTDVALADYQRSRDALSADVFAVTDEIASFDWSFEQLDALHQLFSRGMSAETRFVAGLDARSAAQAVGIGQAVAS